MKAEEYGIRDQAVEFSRWVLEGTRYTEMTFHEAAILLMEYTDLKALVTMPFGRFVGTGDDCWGQLEVTISKESLYKIVRSLGVPREANHESDLEIHITSSESRSFDYEVTIYTVGGGCYRNIFSEPWERIDAEA
jgi:hypothetical protein